MQVDEQFQAELSRLAQLNESARSDAIAQLVDAALRQRLTVHFQTPFIGLERSSMQTKADSELEFRIATSEAVTSVAPDQPAPLISQAQTNDIGKGAHFGQYTIDAWVGDGGSASVYRGHRLVEGMRQTVAIKVLKLGLQAVEARQQFDRERRVLSMLEHGSIARWIDGGVTQQGLAYLVLEFVDGQSITSFARARQLSITARLQLMIEVAGAVDAAHRAFIVHRDLKPGNLMVNEAGKVKLLDFGIAKILQNDAELQTQVQMFTPAYAAPEQRNGGAITAATDVYALGVILGELLTGKRFSANTTSSPSLEVSDEIVEAGAVPVPPAKLRQLMKGDLDNILLKALAADPALRYASAAAFAEDLTRALDGRPVLAHPPSRWYRVKKFVRRNRISVALVSSLSLGVVAASILSLLFAISAQRASERARIGFDASLRAVNSLSVDLAKNLRESRGIRAETVDNVLAKARALVEAIEVTDPGNVALELARIELLIGFSRAHRSVARSAAADSTLDEAWSRINALQARAQVVPSRVQLDALLARAEQHHFALDWAQSAADARAALALASAELAGYDSVSRSDSGADTARIWYARKQLASALLFANARVEVQALLPAAQITQQDLLRSDFNADALANMLDFYTTAASNMGALGQATEARALRESLHGALKQALLQYPNSADILNTQLRLINLDANQQISSQQPTANALLIMGIEEANRAIDSNPNAVSLRLAAKSLYNLRAQQFRKSNQPELELADLRAARNLIKELSDRDVDNSFLRSELSFAERRLASALLGQASNETSAERIKAAESAAVVALAIDRVLLQKNPQRPFARRYLSASLEQIGDVYLQQKRFDEAWRVYQESLNIRQQLAKDFPNEASWLRLVALSYSAMKDLAAARKDVTAALVQQRLALTVWRQFHDSPGSPDKDQEWFDNQLLLAELLLLPPVQFPARIEARQLLEELQSARAKNPLALKARMDLEQEFLRLQALAKSAMNTTE